MSTKVPVILSRTVKARLFLMALVVGAAVLGWSAPASAADVVAPATSASPFAPTIPNPAPAPTNAPPGMVWIPGGEFSMGCQTPNDGICTVATMQSVTDSQPIHRVYVNGFWMDKNDVTNDEFEKFVKATGYMTIAEIAP